MSNVVPQSPVRNRDLWRGMEQYCKRLVREGWEMFIIAGPAGDQGRIGLVDQIKVPAQLWKIALALPSGAALVDAAKLARVFAIRMSNDPQKRIVDWRDARVTVGSLEEDLGFNFFDALDPEDARALKRRIDVE